MEFDPVPSVNDEEQRLAESKKVTLQPIHEGIEPEPEKDSVIVAHHLAETAISNTANDTEQDTQPILPSKEMLQTNKKDSNVVASSHTGKIAGVIILGCVLLTLGVIIYLFMFTKK